MPLFRRFGRPGLLGAVTRTAVVAGTPTMTARALGRGLYNRSLATAEADAYRPRPPESPLAARSESIPSQLAALISLKQSGEIDADEFARAKKHILG